MSSIPAFSQTPPSDICKGAAKAALEHFKGLKPDQFSITVDLIDRAHGTAVAGDYRGDVNYYPCSTVKLFYIAYAAQLLHDGKLRMTPEFDRAAQDMIVAPTTMPQASYLTRSREQLVGQSFLRMSSKLGLKNGTP